MTLTILNDVHIGAVRSGGTTPATAYQLRQDLLQQFEEQLYDITGDLMLLGDLFDGPRISMADLLRTFQVLCDWFARNPSSTLILVNGNHDLSKDSTNFSSFQLLAKLMLEVYGPNHVVHVSEPTHITQHDVYVIPHVTNQDIFNLALQNVFPCRFLAVHCNYDNQFAVESDHSLNLSKEQAEAVPAEYIIFAHEHQRRTELGGKVVIVGNQWPSSVSDCLGNSSKNALVIEKGEMAFPTTWQAEGDYSEQDWRDLEDTGRFIRVTGTATAEEATAVADTIARFRATAKALVITNAVRIEGRDDAAVMELSHSEITSFNVHAELRKILSGDENAKLDKLMKEKAQ